MIYPGEPLRGDRASRCSARSRASATSCRSASPSSERESKLLEAQRLEQRTLYDLEMLEQMGFCHGVENYSRWLDGREPGQSPYTLYDYFPEDFLLVVDESHVTVPQIGAMYRGDRARKETLVELRLPAAVGARQPARCASTSGRRACGQAIYVSATPADCELEQSRRRRGRADHPADGPDRSADRGPAGGGQVDDLLGEIRVRVAASERVLVTTLTKRMAEELTEYYGELGVRSATCTATSRRSSAWRSSGDLREAPSTCSSGSTCCARGSTSRKSRSSRSSTRTRKDSCARRAR